MKDKQLSSIIERRGEKSGQYPKNWVEIARTVKTLAGWCCERCGVGNNEDAPNGDMLTVHHLEGNHGDKFNIELWNLAALCQRCHLRVQNKIKFLRIPQRFNWENLSYYPLTEHSPWMARHIKAYNVWAFLNDGPQIPLEYLIAIKKERGKVMPKLIPVRKFSK